MEAADAFEGTERFEVRRRLGEGGMGVVYEAYDRERESRVALKTLRRTDTRLLSRFKNEFRALHDLRHPNLLSLGELHEVGGAWFFTMELIDGVDFLHHVRRQRAAQDDFSQDPTVPGFTSLSGGLEQPGFDEARLRSALVQLAQGIAALHAADKIHRDIKPSNVLVTRDDRVVVLDFGLVSDADPLLQSEHGELVGSAQYMAPEQAVAAELGPAADWYSMGVILYEALTSRLPHTGANAVELLMRKQQRTPPPPRECVADVPEDLDQLCVELLQIDPALRPRGADVLARLGVDAENTAMGASTSNAFTQATPFVGRAEELGVLHRAFEDAVAAHEPVSVVVSGTSGLGKTELVRRFAGDLTAVRDDVVVLSGRCYERESVPYKAFDEIADGLARYLDRLPDVDTGRLLPLRAGLLPQLFPVFQQVRAIARSPLESLTDLDPQERRSLMFGAFRELLARLGHWRPLVLVVDDLQWAGADSEALLSQILHGPDAPRMLLLATQRPDASAPVVTGDVRDVQLCELPLGEARELAALLIETLGVASPPDPEAVAREADGHPLFIHELLRHIGQHEDEARTLDEALWMRVSALEPRPRELIELLAVAGAPIAGPTAMRGLRFEHAQYEEAAAVLRAGFLARTVGGRGSGRIETYHDRVREAVLAHLDDEQRAAYHGQLGFALEQTGAAVTDPHALVRHFEAAGESTRAAGHAEEAARRAFRTAAFDRAADLFQTALELGDHDGARRLELQVDLARALVNAGRGAEAAEVYIDAALHAEPAERLECQRQAAEQWLITGHIERGLEVLRTLLADIGDPIAPTPRRALMSVAWHRMRLRLRGLQWTERAESETARTLLTRLDVLRAVGLSLGTVDTIRGADFNARFTRLALETGEVRRVTVALAMESAYLASQGGRGGRRGRAIADRVKQLADAREGDAYVTAWATLSGGWVQYFEGRFRSAEVDLQRAEQMFRSETIGTTYERNQARVCRIFCLRQMGAIARVRELAAAYVRDAQQRGDHYLDTTLRRYAGRFAFLADDDPDGARADLSLASWEPPAGAFHLQQWFGMEARGDIALYAGTAADALAELEPEFAQMYRSLLLRVQSVRVQSRWTHARLLLAAAPSADDPRKLLRRVAKTAESLSREHIGYATAFGLLLRAGVDACDGNTSAADSLRAAIDVAGEHDLAHCEQAARRQLGCVLGGDEGAREISRADEWFTGQGVRAPARMARMIAPGFPVAGVRT